MSTGHPLSGLVVTAMAATVSLSSLAGCSRPSMLISMVDGRQALTETTLERDSWWAIDKIVVIEVSGILTNSPKVQLLGEGEHPVSVLLEKLTKARRDPTVKAVILRINSPGGTVVASELMHDEIRRFKESGKPVVAVMMDVAASGGYYIACACDEIAAQPSTITGSIGVVLQMIDVSRTMDLIGVKADAITSGEHKDTGSPFRPMRPEERELFQQIIDEMYGRFVKVVAAGRPGLDEDGVRAIADGRVYTATQAVELGLIDRIATMREVIAGLKQRIGRKNIRLVTYHRYLDYKPNYYAAAPRSPVGDVNLLNIDLSTRLTPPTPRFMYLWCPGY
ncbi:MAG: signal peptide peptidase SppA [Planctomycetes bacterium]|nr:signal peptide peptidase SppA [Planctomycetota bacterium]